MRERDEALNARQRWPERLRAGLRRPLVRALIGVAAIGVLAMLYLNQVASVAVANSELQQLRVNQIRLQREDEQEHARLGTVTNPAYIDARARQMGLKPAPTGTPPAVVVAGGQP